MEKPAKIVLLIALAYTFAIPTLTFAGNAPKEKHSVQQLLKKQQQEKKNLIGKYRFEKKTLRIKHQQERKQLRARLKQQKQSYQRLKKLDFLIF